MNSLAHIEDIARYDGQAVTIRGWLHNRRSSGKIHFLSLRDGSGFMQAVVSKAAVGEEKFKVADHLSQETAVVVHGTVRADSRAAGGYELDVSDFEVWETSSDYPITPKEHGVDYLIDHRHLWVRLERQHAILRVRHEVVKAVRDFLNDRGFVLADPHLHARRAKARPRSLKSTTSKTESLPDAIGAAIQRGDGRGLRQGLLLRPDLSRRKIEDAPPPDGVLDGRAGGGLRRPRRHDGPGGKLPDLHSSRVLEDRRKPTLKN